MNAINAGLFWFAAVVLVPRIGIMGYGWADIASIFAWVVAVILYARRHPAPPYGFTMMWGTGLVLAMISPVTSLWLLAPAAVLLFDPFSILHARAISRRILGKEAAT